jgi:hypothetical protein
VTQHDGKDNKGAAKYSSARRNKAANYSVNSKALVPFSELSPSGDNQSFADFSAD